MMPRYPTALGALASTLEYQFTATSCREYIFNKTLLVLKY